ncbi:hypothetical protein IC757_08100 [Wenzhouxiangella sp. AB-CW3]|uniref:DUF1302 family protein n=1 Tax=Wenzhouxiangella sp. AB-CW3 TaxID=2771012 RepID=UPI00168C01C3|nr:DUF1302 family protein [Wenzhouxiangella sp. AB-CW3]QOC24051.1 hypothetical protein IC757_08100 [Wenzhouxiangella sp. AB-CW3]
MRRYRLGLPVLLLFWAGTVSAQDFFEKIEAEPARSDSESSRIWGFSGRLTQRFHYALADPPDAFPFRRDGAGMASRRHDLQLEARYRPSSDVSVQLAARASHDAELQDTTRLEVDQSYVEWGITPSLNIKTGRQRVSLGESSFFQLADRINPVDERVFGLAELRETLVPVAATRLSHYQARSGLDVVVLHEFRSNRYDEPHGDFDPYIGQRGLPDPLHPGQFHPSQFHPDQIDKERPDISLSNPDLAARLFWSRPWGDIGLFASRLHSRLAVPAHQPEGRLVLDYSRATILGASVNRVFGDWLLKSEYAFSDDASHHAVRDGQAHELMVGGRYTGISNLTLDIELLGSRISPSGASGSEGASNIRAAASIEYEMLNDDLVASLAYQYWTSGSGSMIRMRLDYAVRDELGVFAGFIRYGAGSEEAMLWPYRDNDRVFAGLSLSF